MYKETTKCDQCHIFYGKRKVVSLPLNSISVEAPFQQWGLDFIGGINPNSSGYHRWILIATDSFTKWIEAIPTRRATNAVIMGFLEENILARFGCPKRIVTDNAPAFKSKKMISFCHKYNISLNHSTAYYPQGNGLEKSFNKSLVRIIKKLLEDNKRAWHTKMKYALWDDRISKKRVIGMSPFQLVYGAEVVFPASLGVPVMKLFRSSRMNLIICKGE